MTNEIIEKIEDFIMLQEMTNLAEAEEEKVTIPFAEAKKLLGWI